MLTYRYNYMSPWSQSSVINDRALATRTSIGVDNVKSMPRARQLILKKLSPVILRQWRSGTAITCNGKGRWFGSSLGP